MFGQHFHRTVVALPKILGDVPEGLPIRFGGTHGNREILSVLQVRFILPHLAMWLKNRVYSV